MSEEMDEDEQISLEDLLEELQAISDDITGCKFAESEFEWKCEKCPDGIGACMNYNANAISVLSLHIIQIYKSLNPEKLAAINKMCGELLEDDDAPQTPQPDGFYS